MLQVFSDRIKVNIYLNFNIEKEGKRYRSKVNGFDRDIEILIS